VNPAAKVKSIHALAEAGQGDPHGKHQAGSIPSGTDIPEFPISEGRKRIVSNSKRS
jgi:hypothetical protein